MIPFLDVSASYRELQSELDAAYRRVMDNGWFILGKEVAAFEEEFAAFCGVGHCVTVANGLDALRLTLEGLGIGRGDEVIVPGNTFIATWLAVTHSGATPVPVEPDPDTHNLDPDRLEAAVTPWTRAVIPVHLYGQPADMDPVLDVANQHGLAVIEDAAQAHGARYHGRRAGSLGRAGCFSFYPAKNLGCFGDGGAVTTNDAVLAERLRHLRNYGGQQKYQHDVRGTNSRLDDLQAAFLRVKLPRLDEWNQRRRLLAQRYRDLLADVPGLRLTRVPAGVEPVWHLFVVRHSQRDRLRQHLACHDIETSIHYPVPPHLSGAYASGGWSGKAIPTSEGLAREVLSLPIGPQLREADVVQVCAAVRSYQPALRSAA